jgi:4-oxalomesaconate tautomerase
MMNLGDVTKKSVPKMTMVSAPENGGAISTRTFIPHRCHKTIGVLGAVSVATACLLRGSTAYELAETGNGKQRSIAVEHPTGEMTVVTSLNEAGDVVRAAILRTARKLMDGKVFP